MDESIGTILGRLRRSGGVSMAALVSVDGLIIESLHEEEIEADAVAATAGEGLLIATTIGQQLQGGDMLGVWLEYSGGVLLLAPLNEEALLLVIADDPADLARIRLAVRQEQDRLQAALARLAGF